MRRGWGGPFWSVVALAALALIVRGLSAERRPRRPAPPPAESPAFYVSEVEEGVGAAVAILVDTSGSMSEPAGGDGRPKFVVAREALRDVLRATDAFVARRPEFPIKLAIYGFASSPWAVYPMQRYDREAVAAALARIPGPGGGTAIGRAMLEARAELYRSGVFRKYILAVTDGQNTVGSAPDRVAREIHRKSRGAVSIFFVAFDTDPASFGFLREVGGDVLPARDAAALQAALKQIYEGKILAEAVDQAEAPPAAPGRTPGK